MSKFYIVRTAFFVFALCAATAIRSPGANSDDARQLQRNRR